MDLSRRLKGRDIEEALRQGIRSGELLPGSALPSARLLADEFGVAGITANRALQRLAKEGLVARVRGSGTFVAEDLPIVEANGLRIGVGLDLPVDGSPESAAAFGVTQDSLFAALREGSHAGVLLGREDLGMENAGALDGLDALILSPGWLGPDQVHRLLDWPGPVIVLAYRREDLPFHQVGYDYRTGFLSLIRHLRDLGHERFAVAGIHCVTSEERYEALTAMANLEGIRPESLPRLFVDGVVGDFGRLAGQQIGRLWLKQKRKLPLISLSDFISFGIVDVLREKKLHVGEDRIMASYDNLEGRGLIPFGHPLLTAITHPLAEVSRQAVCLAEKALAGGSGVVYQHRVEARELVVRQSTGG
ncbi:MAG: GntR family transcriptional regulator [Planctomycetota bacterium]|jgi:hypothetical protein